PRVVVALLADGEDDGLLRREPCREVAAAVLEVHAEEALERAEDGAVEHHRLVLLPILPDEAQAEARRQVRVVLHRADLPGALERVLHVKLDLGAVEGALARRVVELEPGALEAGGEPSLGAVPHRVFADALLRPRRELDVDRLELERAVYAVE